jgi:hypothetical protein
VDKVQTLIDIFGVTKADSIKGKTIMSLESEMQNLQSGQAAANNVTTPQQPNVTLQAFTEAWKTITSAERGVPPLGPEAGRMLFESMGVLDTYGGTGTAGEGNFGTIGPLSPEHVVSFAKNITGGSAAQAPPPPPAPPAAVAPQAPPAPVAPQAPPTRPSGPNALDLAAATADVEAERAALAARHPDLAANAPRADVAPGTFDVTIAAPPAVEEPEEVTLCRDLVKGPKWTGQQINKPELATAVRWFVENMGTGGLVRVEEKVVEKIVYRDAETVGPYDTLEVYVDCLPSMPFDTLEDYIDGLLRELEKQCSAKDIRCSDHDALSFGKWKGTLAAMVRETPPELGVYHIDTRSEIYEVVAVELRTHAGRYVRSTR